MSISNLFDINILPSKKQNPEASTTPYRSSFGWSGLKPGQLQINDIVFDIPPEQIQISQNFQNMEMPLLRSKVNSTLKSGHGDYYVSFPLIFTGTSAQPSTAAINKQLIPLLVQLKKTPFCMIENELIRKTLMPGTFDNSTASRQSKAPNMAFSLVNATVSTGQDIPGTLEAQLNFMHFNYFPFSKNFTYRMDWAPFNNLPDVGSKLDVASNISNYDANSDEVFNPQQSKAWTAFWQYGFNQKRLLTQDLTNQFSLTFNLLGGQGNELRQQPVIWNATDMIPVHATMTLSNRIVKIPILNWTFATQQYIGGLNCQMQVTFMVESQKRENLEALQYLILTEQSFTSHYRYLSQYWGVGIKNDLARIFGIDNVTIEGITVDTVPGNPNLLQVTLTMLEHHLLPEQMKKASNLPALDSSMQGAMNKMMDDARAALVGTATEGSVLGEGLPITMKIGSYGDSVMSLVNLRPDKTLPTLPGTDVTNTPDGPYVNRLRTVVSALLEGPLASDPSYDQFRIGAFNAAGNDKTSICYPDLDLPPHPATKRLCDTEPDCYFFNESESRALDFTKAFGVAQDIVGNAFKTIKEVTGSSGGIGWDYGQAQSTGSMGAADNKFGVFGYGAEAAILPVGSTSQQPLGSQKPLSPDQLTGGVNQYKDYINKYSAMYGIDPTVVAGMMMQESSGNPNAVSPRGATGLMQIMPGTADSLARSLSKADGINYTRQDVMTNPELNVRAGCLYMSEQLKTFNNSIPLALAAYNCGPNRASLRAGRIPDIPETQNYVKKITRNIETIKNAGGFSASNTNTASGSNGQEGIVIQEEGAISQMGVVTNIPAQPVVMNVLAGNENISSSIAQTASTFNSKMCCGDRVTAVYNGLIQAAGGTTFLPVSNIGVQIPDWLNNNYGATVYTGSAVTLNLLQSLGPGVAIAYPTGDHVEITAINPANGQLAVMSNTRENSTFYKSLDDKYIAGLPGNVKVASAVVGGRLGTGQGNVVGSTANRPGYATATAQGNRSPADTKSGDAQRSFALWDNPPSASTPFKSMGKFQFTAEKCGFCGLNMSYGGQVTKKNIEDKVTVEPPQAPEWAPDEKGCLSILEKFQNTFKDKALTMRRAYPAFALYFTDEFLQGFTQYINSSYSWDMVKEIKLVRSRKNPVDTLFIQLSNTKGNLLTQEFNTLSAKADDKYKISFNRQIIKEGTDVKLKLGYSNNPDNLELVFTGKITEIEGQNSAVITIVCQSYAIELFQSEYGDDPTAKMGWFQSDTDEIISSLLVLPETAHLGRWMPGQVITPGESNASSAGTGYFDALRYSFKILPNPTDNNVFVPKESAFFSTFRQWWESVKEGSELSHAFKSPGDLVKSLLPFTYVHYVPYKQLPWEIIDEMTLRHPGHIAAVVPYEGWGHHKATLFFGIPCQNYYYKAMDAATAVAFKGLKTNPYLKGYTTDGTLWGSGPRGQLTGDEKKAVSMMDDRMKPFRNYFYIDSEHHIIDNGILTSARDTFNGVEVAYVSDARDAFGNASHAPDPSSFYTVNTFKMKANEAIREDYMRWYHTRERNCEGAVYAARYCHSYLFKHLKDLYQGEVIITGEPAMKPYDICYMYDTYNDMAGPFEVEQVTHIFSQEEGFVTCIVPDLVVQTNEIASMALLDSIGAYMGSVWLGLNKKQEFNSGQLNSKEIGDITWTGAANTGTITPNSTAVDKGLSAAGVIGTLVPIGLGIVGTGVFTASMSISIFASFGIITIWNWARAMNPIRITPLIWKGRPFICGLDGFTLDTAWGHALRGVYRAMEGWGDFFNESKETIEALI